MVRAAAFSPRAKKDAAEAAPTEENGAEAAQGTPTIRLA
jgi:hypothetical protein